MAATASDFMPVQHADLARSALGPQQLGTSLGRSLLFIETFRVISHNHAVVVELSRYLRGRLGYFGFCRTHGGVTATARKR